MYYIPSSSPNVIGNKSELSEFDDTLSQVAGLG